MENSDTMDTKQLTVNRRRFIAGLSAAGVGSTLMPGALVAVAKDAKRVTVEMIEAAQKLTGLSFSRSEQEGIVERLNRDDSPLIAFDALRDTNLGYEIQPALVFNPLPPGKTLPSERRPLRREDRSVSMPSTDDELAFLQVSQLSRLVETRQVKPTELTDLYLARLKQYNPMLRCVVNLTEELARRQARKADEEIGDGRYRGPLHGIPWGAKDLLAVRGTKTTWGASPFETESSILTPLFIVS